MTHVRHVIGFLIAASIMIAAHPARSQQDEAPFGLKWGASSEDVRAAGIDLKEFADSTFGNTYAASKLTKVLADQETTFVSFGFSNKLWRNDRGQQAI